MKSQNINFNKFIILVALLMAIASLTVNMLLPAFQVIGNDLEIERENQIHLTISLLYLGMGTSQLLYGALSDSIGRIKTVYIGLSVFILGCIIAVQANQFNVLLAGQILQGIGLGAPRVMSVAIVRDRFEGNRMARAMSFIMAIYVLTPVISPIFGQMILDYSGWRSLYLVFIGFALLLFILYNFQMPETLSQSALRPFTTNQIVKAMTEILQNVGSMSYIIILGLYSGLFITYLNLSQSVFEVQYHLGDQYPFYFALLSLSIGVSSFINGKLVLRFGSDRLVKVTINLSIVVATLFLIFSTFSIQPFWTFAVFAFLQLFCYGILIGNLNAQAMRPFGHIAGVAASVSGALSTLISVPISILIGSFYNYTTLPLTFGFLIIGVLSILMFNFINRTNEKENSKQYI